MVVTDFQDFRRYYNQTIHPELSRLEYQRKRLITLIVLSVFGICLLVLVGIYLQSFLIILYLLLIIGAYLTFLLIRVRQFIKSFKPKVVNLILLYIKRDLSYQNLQYNPQKPIEKETFIDSQLFKTSLDVYQGEDYIAGKIVNCDFEMSELSIAEQSRIQPRLEPVFKGIFIRAHIPSMERTGKVFLYPIHREPYLIRTVQELHRQKMRQVRKMNLIKGFANEFTVYYSNNEYFDSHFDKEIQQEILKYANAEERNLYISMENSNLYMGIEQNRDILEPNLFKTNIDFKQTVSFLRDIIVIFNLIKSFDYYNN